MGTRLSIGWKKTAGVSPRTPVLDFWHAWDVPGTIRHLSLAQGPWCACPQLSDEVTVPLKSSTKIHVLPECRLPLVCL